MFGMSSEEFWEESPQLYWAYRTFYLKKIETEKEKLSYECWLNGKINSVSFGIALNNAFSKQKVEFPNYDEIFGNKVLEKAEKEKELTPKEQKNRVNLKVQEEFNAWARF